jgi:2-polyprenyl-3-methyl-5-hydroxy-6-metoxy-1,4-benzoquinol methylase
MTTLNECRLCTCQDLSQINTYKHIWFSCDECGNIFRQQKKNYFLNCLPEALFKLIPKTKREIIINCFKKKKTGEEFYNYYLHEEQKTTTKGTPWENELPKLTQELKSLNIDLQGKAILDLSGGPGFLAQELKDIARKVLVTEFSQGSVERMKKILNIDAIRFDYNTDDLSQITTEKFDIVLIRYSINFCLDIPQLLKQLKNITTDNAIIYVSFVLPTLGTCLRWQFDDYTYLVLYHPETIIRLFSEGGFTLMGRYPHGSDHYLSGRLFKFLAPFMLSYRFINSFKKCNQDLTSKGLALIFKKTVGHIH